MVVKKNVRRKKMDSLMRYYFVVLFMVTFPSPFHCQYQGQSCFDQQKGEHGVCKALTDCPEVVADIGVGIYPQNCGFEGKVVIVCCPQASARPTTAAEVQKPEPTGNLLPGEKSKQACKNYEKIGYEKERLPSLSHDSVDNCPWEPHAIPIFRATNASSREFPHMAYIGYGVAPDISWLCGGILISDRFLLTAAHCLISRQTGNASVVRLGDLNYLGNNVDYYPQQINVKTLHKHPNYAYPQFYNDIALVELEKPAKLSANVKPACLQTSDTNEPRALVTGWNRKKSTNDYLLKLGVEYFTPEECNITFSNNRRSLSRGIDDNLQICYGSKSVIIDFCEIGTGVPLQIYAKDVYCSYYIFGIGAFGRGGCSYPNIPDVYVKVKPYIKWIEDTVWP